MKIQKIWKKLEGAEDYRAEMFYRLTNTSVYHDYTIYRNGVIVKRGSDKNFKQTMRSIDRNIYRLIIEDWEYPIKGFPYKKFVISDWKLL